MLCAFAQIALRTCYYYVFWTIGTAERQRNYMVNMIFPIKALAAIKALVLLAVTLGINVDLGVATNGIKFSGSTILRIYSYGLRIITALPLRTRPAFIKMS